MDSFTTLIARGTALLRSRDTSAGMSPAMVDGMIAILVVLFVSILTVVAWFAVRRIRRNRAIARQSLPTHHKHSHRRLTITASPYGRASSIYVYDEKSSETSSPPRSPNSPSVPEIRITFPDEQDESGQRRSGRVVVVRVGERGIGLEPLDEPLPLYEKESSQPFHSIDMESIGGLKEKS